MIISDSWLQTDYGVNFFRFLLDNYKVHAIIDISARVFPVPLIGACIVLLEKYSDEGERRNNKTVFMYLDVSKGYMDVDEILKLIDEAKTEALPGQAITKELPSGAKVLVKVYTQGELMKHEGKIINLIFSVNDVLNSLRQSPLIAEVSKYFEASFGNILYLYLTSTGRIRGVRNVGGEEFFYLNEDKVKQFNVPGECLYPLLPSPRYLRFFTFTQQDWDELRKEGDECYLFLCHRPRNELSPQVLRYIQLGEGSNAQIKTRGGSSVSDSSASRTRREHRGQFFEWYDLEGVHKDQFFDWYDLGGVVKAPIYVARGAQYWVRFALAKFHCALDDRILALIPRQGVQFDEVELKALLAYLNSSFTQLQAEVRGRSTGGGMIELDVKPLSSLLILDVKALPRNEVEKLAQLFDRLESEARGLGGADEVENVFGSELASELTGKTDVKAGIQGLFNTVIREIDYEIARILGLEHLVETVRAMVLELVSRRLARAGETKREAIKGTEELPKIEKPKKKKGRSGGGSGIARRLDEFFGEGGGA
jgi:hypothetical protein